MSKSFTRTEVASHNQSDDIWIVINNEVFDITLFQEEHPGGKKIMQTVAGKDATKQFNKYHREAILNKYKPDLQVGSVDPEEKPAKSGSGFSFGFFRRKD